MDKELREFLEQRLVVFSKKDDVEKLRQETRANFHKLSQENKELILGWIDQMKAEMGELRREGKVNIDSVREDIRGEMKKFEMWIQSVETLLKKMKEETNSSVQRSRQEVNSSHLQAMLRETMESLGDQILRTMQEVAALNKNVGAGLREVREELGSMIKFSYSDLEKKLAALEARVKTLEKMVLP